MFIDATFAKQMGFALCPLRKEIKVYNVDYTPNKNGFIMHYVDVAMEINSERSQVRFLATGLGRQKVILGLPWLIDQNPDINWRKGTLKWRKETLSEEQNDRAAKFASVAIRILLCSDDKDKQDTDDEELLISYLQDELTNETQETWSKTTMGHSTAFAQKAEAAKTQRTPEEIIPPEFHSYLETVFSEKEATRFPTERPWDHAIQLKETFKPHISKVYPMTQKEDEAVKTFLQENLDNGYIKPSNSPQAAGFFFVA